jgi:hypothetical protein
MKWDDNMRDISRFLCLILAILIPANTVLAADTWAVNASFPGDSRTQALACSHAQTASLTSMKNQCRNDGGRLVDFSFSKDCGCSRSGDGYTCTASGKGYCQKEPSGGRLEKWVVTGQYPGEGSSRAAACNTAKNASLSSARIQCSNDDAKVIDFDFGRPECLCSEANGNFSCMALVKAFCGR